MIELVTGIDDFGTGTNLSQGWTFFTFEKKYLDAFNLKAKDILDRSKLTSFHGKDFRRIRASSYKEFLFLIKNTLEESHNSFICSTLLNPKWKESLGDFSSNLVGTTFQIAGVNEADFIEASKKIATCLMTYQRISSNCIESDSVHIEIDADSVLKNIHDTVNKVGSLQISIQSLLYIFLNKYKTERFPTAPDISDIRVMNDEDSFLIQGADVLGNFSLAVASKALGCSSKTYNEKEQIFREVFGDISDKSNLLSGIELVGNQNEISLKHDGSFTLTMKYSSENDN